MRTTPTSLALSLTFLACGGGVSSPFAGTWSCVNNIPAEGPETWPLTLVANSDGSVSTPAVSAGAPGQPDPCTSDSYNFVVSGSVAKSQTITCNPPPIDDGGISSFEATTLVSEITLTLAGGKLTYDESGTTTRKTIGLSNFAIDGTCTKD